MAVKEAVFPFARFPGVDLILGPEMKSTGEVMGLDTDFGRAFAKSQLGSGTDLPRNGCVFVSVRDRDKAADRRAVRKLLEMGFDLVATPAPPPTSARWACSVRAVNKVQEGRPHIVDEMQRGEVQLVFNTAAGRQGDRRQLQPAPHRADARNPLLYDGCRHRAAVQAIGALRQGWLEVAPLQSYFLPSEPTGGAVNQ